MKRKMKIIGIGTFLGISSILWYIAISQLQDCGIL